MTISAKNYITEQVFAEQLLMAGSSDNSKSKQSHQEILNPEYIIQMQLQRAVCLKKLFLKLENLKNVDLKP